MKNYLQHYPHEADIDIRGYGVSLASSFEPAAMTLTAVSVDLNKVKKKQSVIIKCENPDLQLLTADGINSIIYEMALQKTMF